MCGIIGCVTAAAAANVVPVLLEGLRRLEYRGYDSAGLAIVQDQQLVVRKRCGKVRMLEAALTTELRSSVGIAHTRWATHGEPSDVNAHPHTDTTERFAVVHNGIVENADELRAQLVARGVQFVSETDTEVIAHLLAMVCAQQGDPYDALELTRQVLSQLIGAYGLLILDREHPQQLIAARNGSPLILGLGEDEMLVASDAAALVRHTNKAIYLDDGDFCVITAHDFQIRNLHAPVTARTAELLPLSDQQMNKGAYAHFFLKEIYDQPTAVSQTLSGRIDRRFATARLGGLNLSAQELQRFKRVRLLGCGSAYISGLLGGRILERLSRIPCEAEAAAEFRYRNPVIEPDTLYVAISQSGETFDTLAAVEEVKRKGATAIGVINGVGSSIARACGRGMYLHAGAEVSVVSSKTFVSTVTALTLLALHLARMKDLSVHEGQTLITALDELPNHLSGLLRDTNRFAELGNRVAQFDHVYFIGRGEGLAVAMEGALKLKEVSYIHAEAYAASELKHGPLALISPQTLTVAIVPEDELLSRNRSTLAEVQSRGGPLLVIANAPVPGVPAQDQVIVPALHRLLDPLVMVLPLQLLAYHSALSLGREIDQPRNLAKSVTVE